MQVVDEAGPSAAAAGDAVERVLRERAAALAGRRDDSDRGATEAHLLAAVGEVTVALPALLVRHVVPAGHLATVPGSGPAIVGLSAVLGTVVPVADAAVLLHVGAAPRSAAARLVLVDDGADGLLGLLVDAVVDLVAIDPGDVHPDVAPGSTGSGLVVGVTADGRIVLDLDAVLADPRLWPPGSFPTNPRTERT